MRTVIFLSKDLILRESTTTADISSFFFPKDKKKREQLEKAINFKIKAEKAQKNM